MGKLPSTLPKKLRPRPLRIVSGLGEPGKKKNDISVRKDEPKLAERMCGRHKKGSTSAKQGVFLSKEGVRCTTSREKKRKMRGERCLGWRERGKDRDLTMGWSADPSISETRDKGGH